MLYLMTLSWNGCEKLTKLKESLLPALEGLEYKWFIKDNGSKDDTVTVASQWGSKVEIIPYKNNSQNFSAGMNYLFNVISPSNNDSILLLNNDVIFNDIASIKKMIAMLNKDKSIGAVGCRLLHMGTNKLQHAGVVFNPIYKTPMHFRAGQVSDEVAEKDRLFQVVTGAVMLTRAEYFRNANKKNPSGISGMDENYHWAFDDVDLCLSIHYNMQKKIVYCGSTNIFHEESATLKKNPANKLFLPHNIQYLLAKWRGRYTFDQGSYTKDPKYNLYHG
jgi:GT2 family glycosyltransferase